MAFHREEVSNYQKYQRKHTEITENTKENTQKQPPGNENISTKNCHCLTLAFSVNWIQQNNSFISCAFNQIFSSSFLSSSFYVINLAGRIRFRIVRWFDSGNIHRPRAGWCMDLWSAVAMWRAIQKRQCGDQRQIKFAWQITARRTKGMFVL